MQTNTNVTRILRVLFLDEHPRILPPLSDLGVRLELTSEKLWNPEPYDAPARTLERIADLTAVRNYDVVIVGNNLGVGVSKASAIAPRLKSRSIVVWHEYVPGYEAPYAAIGLKSFMSRGDLPAHIRKMVTR